jgi:SAM-dependent methyltransferase
MATWTYRRLTSTTPRQAVGDRTTADAATGRVDPDLAWHRAATGGRYDQEGAWVFDFLRRQGMRPDQFVLDVGCGSLAAASRLLPWLEQSHYWGYEPNADLFVAGVQIELPKTGVAPERGHFIVNDTSDLTEAVHQFDLAIASSFVRRFPLNIVARAVASVVRKLTPGGRFFLVWPDNPDARNFEPIERGDLPTTYSDRAPYHYSYDTLAAIVETLGARAERLPDTSHPRGESVMLITAGG